MRSGTFTRVSEKVEQAHIVRLLRMLGGHVYVIGTRRPMGDYPGTRQTPGIPDVFAFLARHAVWVEVKGEGGRLRPEQAAFRDECVRLNVVHVTGGVDEMIAWLVDHGYLDAKNVPYYRRLKEDL